MIENYGISYYDYTSDNYELFVKIWISFEKEDSISEIK